MVTAAQIWSVYGEQDSDPSENVAERQELIQRLAKMDFNSDLARSASTPILREILRFLEEQGVPSVQEEGEVQPDDDRDEMTRRQDEMASCRFDEADDALSRAAYNYPQRPGQQYLRDAREATRKNWREWNDRDVATCLAAYGFTEADLDGMTGEQKKAAAGKLVNMSDKELAGVVRNPATFKRGVVSHAAPQGMKAPHHSFAERKRRSFNDRRSRLNKFWEKNGAELESHGESFQAWHDLVMNPNLTDGEAARLIHGKA